MQLSIHNVASIKQSIRTFPESKDNDAFVRKEITITDTDGKEVSITLFSNTAEALAVPDQIQENVA